MRPYEKPNPSARHAEFANKLVDKLTERGWDIYKLADEMKQKAKSYRTKIPKYGYSTLYNWVSGEIRPNVEDFVILAEVLDLSTKQLLGWQASSSDEKAISEKQPISIFVNNEIAYKAERKRIVEEAKDTLWIQVRSPHSMSEEVIRTLILSMKREVKVKLITCDPDDIVTMEMLARRRYMGENDATDVARLIKTTCLHILGAMKQQDIDLKLLEVTALSFVPSTVIYLSDPNTDNMKLLTATPVYQNFPESGMFVLANGEDNPNLLKLYLEQFELLLKAQEIARPLNLELLQ